jgi:acyl phosphate:glycerol-3-phosphate acyltransferase
VTLWAVVALGAVASFAAGSIPVGLWIGKLKGVDVRTVGSGNIGAMNVARALGSRWFVVVFGLDLLKGLAPTVAVGVLLSQPWAEVEMTETVRDLCWLGVGICAVFGHNYSPFVGFKGGKGVSTSLGVALGIYPDLTIPAACCFVVWVLGISITRMSSVGSLLGGVMFPILYVALAGRFDGSRGVSGPLLAFTLVTAGLIVARHRANIARILSGTEPRVGDGGPGAGESPDGS